MSPKKSFVSALKKWVLSLSLSAIVASLLLVSVTVAFLFSVSDTKTNYFFPGYVDCEVVESFDGTIKSSVKIQNTGNTDAYIRVSFVSYTQNVNGAIIGESAFVPEFDLGENWSRAADGYYYYKLPIAPGGLTGEMLGSPMVLSQQTDANGNVVGNQVVEVFAEAIQAYPEDAVVYAWESVAAVTGTDDHLVLKVKVYDNFLDSNKYVAKYRGMANNSDKETVVWKNYHQGLLNNNVVSADDTITMTSNDEGRIILSLYFVNVIELKDFALYFTNAANVASVMVYSTVDELRQPDERYILGAATKSSLSGNYISSDPAEQELEYTLSVNATKHSRFATIIINTDGPQQPVGLCEIRVMGYMSHNNVAPAAQYKGGAGTQSVAFGDTDTGVDYTAWNEYHTGKLNDTTRSSAEYDEKPQEKVMVRISDTTTDSMYLIYKLDKPALIDMVDVYIGALNLHGNPHDAAPTEVIGNNQVLAMNVYVSETENQADWKFLGTDSNGIVITEDMYLRMYTAADNVEFGQYVIIEVKGTPGQMYYGFNEVQIWSCADLDVDE